MAASFIQFCATCENQITIPDNAILYCSTRCRNADTLKPIALSLQTLSSFTYPKITPCYRPSTRPKPPAKMATAQKAPSLSISPPTQCSETQKVTVNGKLTPSSDETTPRPDSRRTKRSIESTAAYRFLLQFQRNADGGSSADNASCSASIPSRTSSPSLTSASSDFDMERPAGKDDVLSLPSLSTSAATETVNGSLETKYSVSAAAMGKNVGQRTEPKIYQGKSV
ncbi:predicted protein [Uncinocarpus reesii 1704]|uniref:Uncharacterized protein n=1 Tax=Uncinocarpus reesii (strain UAMH 1704) TaxID=336963 RepID=C4JEC5_UNCRE|nr:uncharacterized protein UREG_00741 [Uncinocarpus reesii 1704]EEP75894.1 predicted protein [Uncinocarpus reesii 1704]